MASSGWSNGAMTTYVQQLVQLLVGTTTRLDECCDKVDGQTIPQNGLHENTNGLGGQDTTHHMRPTITNTQKKAHTATTELAGANTGVGTQTAARAAKGEVR